MMRTINNYNAILKWAFLKEDNWLLTFNSEIVFVFLENVDIRWTEARVNWLRLIHLDDDIAVHLLAAF